MVRHHLCVVTVDPEVAEDKVEEDTTMSFMPDSQVEVVRQTHLPHIVETVLQLLHPLKYLLSVRRPTIYH